MGGEVRVDFIGTLRKSYEYMRRKSLEGGPHPMPLHAGKQVGNSGKQSDGEEVAGYEFEWP